MLGRGVKGRIIVALDMDNLEAAKRIAEEIEHNLAGC